MNRMLTRLATATCTAIACLAAAVVLPAQECYTPLEWIPKNYVSHLDRNKNFVDDEIDQMDDDEVIDVILCLNSCPSAVDQQRFMAELGTAPSYRSPYLPIVIYEGVTAAGARELGKDERVAMVELARQPEWSLDVSMAAARIRSSTTYAGVNVEDAFPTLNGSGINIAIMDSGVDNEPSSTTSGTVHTSFPAWKYVAGYNAMTDQQTDPDDDVGHGTHVAGIALGTGGSAGTYRGAAPSAGLIDIKIGNMFGIPTVALFRGYDKIIERRHSWNIDVVNMSFGTSVNSNGTDASSQMVNRIVREGVVVTVAAGNNGPANIIGSPAASDFAITVANANDMGTISRVGDAIWTTSSRGPRLNDGDGIVTDEQKPDVAAYGRQINSAQHNTTSGYVNFTGTSMAAPQVAGLAALILQANPGMDPLSVKDLIERTAEDFGTAGWDVDFGHGIINGYAALNEVVTSLQTDVYFDVYCHRPGSPVWWQSPDVTPVNPSVVEGTTNGVTVVVRNGGPNTAIGVKVRVGIYNFSNSTADFDICLHSVPPLVSGGTYTFTCPWIPEANGLTPPVVHACLKAYIIYPNDTDPSNNCAQHNVNIVQTHSPALFHFTVVNPTGEDMEMEIVTDPPAKEIEAQGWLLTLEEPVFSMGAHDCPRTVTIALEAVGGNPPERMPVTVAVRGRQNGEIVELGGVQIIGENGNGTPRPPDNVVFGGIRHTSLGQARLRSTPAALIVSDLGTDADGVLAQLGTADFWRGTLAEFDAAALPDGSTISFTPRGLVNGNPDAPVATMTLTDNGDYATLSSNFRVTPNTLTVEVYNDGQLVASDARADDNVANIWTQGAMQITPFRWGSGSFYGEVAFENDVDIELLTWGITVTGDRIIVRSDNLPPIPDHIATAEIRATGLTSFAMTGEAGGLFERPFRAMGNPVLEWGADGEVLTARRITARSAVGARAELPNLQGYDLFWTPTEIGDVPLGTHLNISASGELEGIGVQDLGSVTVMRSTDGEIQKADITADLSTLNANAINVELYSGGTLTYSGGGFASYIGYVDQWPVGGGHAVDEASQGPSFRLRWQDDVQFVMHDGSVVSGNDLRILPENVDNALLSVTEVGVYVVGLDELQITSEEAVGLSAVSVDEPVAGLPFRLHQNFPNPFDEQTVFRFDLFSAAHVELDVYDMLGRKVASVLARELTPGTHEAEWKRSGLSVPSGTYIYRLKVRPLNADQTYELQRQMVILD